MNRIFDKEYITFIEDLLKNPTGKVSGSFELQIELIQKSRK